jgi:hypothetical protein
MILYVISLVKKRSGVSLFNLDEIYKERGLIVNGVGYSYLSPSELHGESHL